MAGSGALRRLGRREWAWSGQVPGSPDRVVAAVTDALRLMLPVKLETSGSLVVARVGGAFRASWAAGEQITVRVHAVADGSAIEMTSRSAQLSWSDGGRNRANLVALLGTLGIDGR